MHSPCPSPAPRITIVVPTLNQGRYIEGCIRSILLQSYSNLELVVMDGGSSDNTIEIIKKYSDWITSWQSKPDGGQSRAINQGFAMATGEVYGWLNSDDFLLPGSLQAVAAAHASQGGTPGVFLGYGEVINGDGAPLAIINPARVSIQTITESWAADWFIQPACFWSSEAWKAVGGLDERYHLLMDIDLWLRFLERFDFHLLNKKMAVLRYYPETKSNSSEARVLAEWIALKSRYQDPASVIAFVQDSAAPLYKAHKQLHDIACTRRFAIMRRLGIF
jgi:glycosyltransferase involved in cell wall biosynthesis